MTRRLAAAIGVLMVLIVPRAAFACPVCFGQSDSPLALGINRGIFVMLGLVAVVLAGFATFFIQLVRRARLAEREDPPHVESSRVTG